VPRRTRRWGSPLGLAMLRHVALCRANRAWASTSAHPGTHALVAIVPRTMAFMLVR
jgi:hypothetical protein